MKTLETFNFLNNFVAHVSSECTSLKRTFCWHFISQLFDGSAASKKQQHKQELYCFERAQLTTAAFLLKLLEGKKKQGTRCKKQG